MRLATTFLATTAGSALAGNTTMPTETVGSPYTIAQAALSYLSKSCQATVKNLTEPSSAAYQCLRVDALLPAILTNNSIIPPVDHYLSVVCGAAACNSTTLNNTAMAIITGCQSDLDKVHVTSNMVHEVVGLYPLAREIACLKTTNPNVLKNATIPLNSTAFNNTNGTHNGTFCFTEIVSDLSGYLGENLTNAYIDSAVLGGNSSALHAIESIPPKALCSDCIISIFDLIESEYPKLGNIVVSPKTNATVNSYFKADCAAQGFNITTNGTLPDTIIEGAENSTFPITIVAGNATYTPGPNARPAPTVSVPGVVISGATTSGAMMEKRRWMGEN